MTTPIDGAPAPTPAPTFATALRFWWLLGWISFGGPAGQIAIMHAELVERRRWFTEATFLRGLDYCMLLPGPEAQQLATYLGWRLHGVRGGIVAGVLFVLPATLLLWLLAWLYVLHGARPELAGVLLGLKAGVLALVAQALWRLAGRALRSPLAWLFALAALLALALLRLPFPVIVLGAGVLGALIGRWRPRWLAAPPAHAADETGAVLAGPSRTWPAALACFALWLLPLGVVWLATGPDSTLSALGVFFAEAALVTFGGAYAVLPYVAQHAVEHYGWLSTEQMIVGLGLAETTPGPLIIVLEYVGFLAAWQHPDGLAPLLAATLGALLTVWVTFLPSFGFIFAGAPYLERLDRIAPLRHALAAVTAAVLGVIASLALWFGAAVCWPQGRPQPVAITIALALLVLLLWRRVPVPLAVLTGAGLGALANWVGAA